MRVGIDVFTLNPLKLDPCAQLDLIKEMGLEGAQFGGLRSLSKNLDPGELRAVRERADALGLYSHVSLSITCNPLLARLTPEEHRDAIAKEIELAAACGWHELHSSLGGGDERYLHETPWPEHLAAAGRLIRSLGPALRQHGSRINLETHGDATTAELVRLVEDVGPDIAGICLDTANVLCHCEDPVLAAKRAAPYTHLTHVKDAVAYFTDHGFRRQTLPPGRGAIDWPVVLPILAEHSPNLPLSIEDHKWLFKFDCFDKKWLALHPDLALPEFAAFMRLVWQCQQRFSAGELPDPDTYERIPFADEVKERLAAGAGYLKGLIASAGLHDRPHDDRPRSLSIMIK